MAYIYYAIWPVSCINTVSQYTTTSARPVFVTMLLTVQVVASLGRPLVPWSIIELNDEEVTFTVLFERIQAGSFDIIEVSDDLKRAQLSRTFVGSKRDALMTIGNDQKYNV